LFFNTERSSAARVETASHHHPTLKAEWNRSTYSKLSFFFLSQYK